MKQNSKKQKLSRSELTLMFSLIWPCILENMTATMVSLVDTAMVGSIGAVATAAVGLCSSPTWLMNGLARSLGVGGTAIAARAIGAGDYEEAAHTGRQVFRAGILLALLITLFTFFGAPVIPVLMQANAEVCADAEIYLRIISIGYLFHYTAMVMGALLRGAGDTRTPMVAGLMANLCNVAGNFFLIYPSRTLTIFGRTIPVWGAGMGIRGAAAASAVSIGVSGLFLLIYMFTPKSALRIRFSLRDHFDLPLLRRVLRIAFPAAMERVTINMGQVIFASMIASIGTAQVAAYHITCTIEALGYMPANGFSTAATTMVGQKLGAKEPDSASRLGYYSIRLSLIVLTIIGILLYLVRSHMAGLFTSDPEVLHITQGLLILCALVQPFNALSITCQGALSGAGDTFRPFLYSLITMWGIRIVFSWLLGFRLGFNVYGIYFSMIIDLAVRSAMLNLRFAQGKWKLRQV